MSSSELSRRAALLALLAVLPGCFRPMLAEGSAARGLEGRVALPRIDGRLGYLMVKRLEDRFGRPRQPDLRLEVSLTTTERGLAIAQDNTVTRRTVTARARWALFGPEQAGPILRDTEVAQAGFDATTSLFATRAAEQDIERRLAEEVAERIARKIQARAGQVTARS
ncbi:MAG: LPS assembly lipoprotein LptE [Paracoccaceae bacterium]